MCFNQSRRRRQGDLERVIGEHDLGQWEGGISVAVASTLCRPVSVETHLSKPSSDRIVHTRRALRFRTSPHRNRKQGVTPPHVLLVSGPCPRPQNIGRIHPSLCYATLFQIHFSSRLVSLLNSNILYTQPTSTLLHCNSTRLSILLFTLL